MSASESRSSQDKRRNLVRIIVYVAVAFALTWGYWFAVVYPAVDPSSGLSTNGMAAFLVGGGMLFPAIAVVITRFVTREGFRNAYLKPVNFKGTWKVWVLAWFGPSILMVLGAVLYFLIFPGDLSFANSMVRSQMMAQAQAAGVQLTDEMFFGTVVAQLAMAVFLAPVLNIITCFGEEWGWRGYLLPKLRSQVSIVPALLIGGVIWGLWHAPMTVLGHNYGLGYPGYPFAGIAAMCLFCTAVGVFFSYVTLKSGSCLPAAIGHGALNGFVAAPLFFSLSGGNPFVGPCATGIIGGIGFIVLAAVLAVALRNDERRGALPERNPQDCLQGDAQEVAR